VDRHSEYYQNSELYPCWNLLLKSFCGNVAGIHMSIATRSSHVTIEMIAQFAHRCLGTRITWPRMVLMT